MDLSKLPRLSKTDGPAEDGGRAEEGGVATETRPEATPYETYRPAAGVGAEAWVSIAVGVILLLMTPYTLQFISSKLLGTSFGPFIDPFTNARVDYITMTDGSRIPYTKLLNFWSDLAVTAFALVLVLDGVALMLSRRAWVVLGAMVITVLATLGNLIYLVATYSQGLAVISALAVAFGVYIALYQWKLYTQG